LKRKHRQHRWHKLEIEMRYETVDITPEMAAKWLESNAEFNRKLRQTVVDRYARDMLNGAWNLTHQGVAFDTKGRLIDGQHRLAAIAKAGVSVRMTVVRDTPAGAFDHVDIGFGRTTADVLSAQGEGWITNEHIAIARFMEAGQNTRATTIARSPFELRDMVELHKNALSFVFQNLERRVKGVTIAPVLAAVAVAYYSEMDRAKLADFLRLLVSGIAQDPGRDSTTIRLREWLRDTSGSASSASRMEAFMKTQRVVKAYMVGETLTKLYTPSEAVYNLKRRATATA
jgi:hypothetical protein